MTTPRCRTCRTCRARHAELTRRLAETRAEIIEARRQDRRAE